MTPKNTNRKHATATLFIAPNVIQHLRISRVAPTTHPVLTGDRNYLRTLRAAEMAAWEAGLPLSLAESFSKAVARAGSE